MRLSLTPANHQRLHQALVDAFDTPSFEQLLLFRLGYRLDVIANPLLPFDQIVFKTLQRAQMEGWTSALLLQAMASRAKDVALADVAARVGVSPKVTVDSAGGPGDGANQAAPGLWLQSLVDPAEGFLNLAEVIEVFSQRLRQVCVVEINGQPKGTGFLVGPDRVLTNHHVVSSVLDGRFGPADVKLRFDYWHEQLLGAQRSGVLFSLAGTTVAEAIPHHSPPTVDELAGKESADEPCERHLDFALLAASGAPGNATIDVVGAGASGFQASTRGWIQASDPPSAAAENQTLIILQHPEGGPLSLAWNAPGVLSVNSKGTRMKYRNNTSPGSSGSPCFNGRFQIVGLHHSGNLRAAAGAASTIGNEGVPMRAIMRSLRARGETTAFAS
ncbi:serine protease [Sorangium cellulosum So ce56]|uniref:Serine protease n=1 Tax=Sorangium cellulosum (strain So ce56) TaxID=448385 RepID=A9ERR5_SORC5|nr:trypsin-like peptidase domain-containing protein [Sorangium cellulosum]CAN97320.1 serine protease [Sorangium cellulosum So ce56]